jgi:hypothetical protein
VGPRHRRLIVRYGQLRLYRRRRSRQANCNLSTWRPEASTSRMRGSMWRRVPGQATPLMWHRELHTAHRVMGHQATARLATGRLDRLMERRATEHKGLVTGHKGLVTGLLPTTGPPARCTAHRQSMSSASTPTHPHMWANTCRGHLRQSPTAVAVVASSISATVGGPTAIEAAPRERKRAVPGRFNDVRFSRPALRAVAQIRSRSRQ